MEIKVTSVWIHESGGVLIQYLIRASSGAGANVLEWWNGCSLDAYGIEVLY